MFLLEAKDILKQFAARTILEFDQLWVYSGDKIGIVGANGSGKTTLLNLLSGELKPDRGSVVTSGVIQVLEQFPVKDSKLSGGELQKREIVRIKQQEKLLLFLDEPTSNLDSDGRKWLVEHLKQVETLLLISHDREVLDQVCNRIIEIEAGKLSFFTGNYSDYEKAKAEKRSSRQEEHDKAQRERQQLQKAAQQKEAQITRLYQRNRRMQKKNNSEARLGIEKVSNSHSKLAHEMAVLKRRYDRVDQGSRIKPPPSLRLDLSITDPPGNRRVITAEALDFSYGDHVIFKNVSFWVERGERLAILGGNGSGKTTLLEEIIGGNSAIKLVPKLKIGVVTQDFSQLSYGKSVLENMMDVAAQPMEVVYSVLAGLLFTGADVEKKAEVLSGGERTRLALARLLVSDINCIILDEPTNFLDIPSITALEKTLVDYEGTLILISHDSHFVDKVATRRLVIKDKLLASPDRDEKPVRTDKLLLELERTRLVETLGSVGEKERPTVEARYQQVLAELAQF